MTDRLAARLDDLAARGATMSYGELAHDLAIPGPGSIATLTGALETLMEQDARAGRPLRAALCRARLSDLPAQGFFDHAEHLGCYAGGPAGENARNFVAKTRTALFEAAKSR